MKIGLIGNMNNNNFSFMRYLRKLGYDSYLILLNDEVNGNSSHFKPEADTWHIKKWKKYIITSKIYENPISVFRFPFSLFFFLKSIIDFLIGKNQIKFPISDKYIYETFSKYDILIGSGLTPAILNRVNIKLDLFFPYSFGVEWVGNPIFNKKLKSKNLLTRYFAKKIIAKQLNGLKKTKRILSSYDELTLNTLKKNKLELTNSLFPMVYNLDKKRNDILSYNSHVNDILEIIENSSFSILSHARHLWVNKRNYSTYDWIKFNKNNDWIVKAFHKLLTKTKSKSLKLILFEYGEDFLDTKHLCNELKISDQVIWVPKMNRREIMLLISKVDVCIGEFYQINNMLFGGTGYEVLASGKPFIQSFNFKENDFNHKFNSSLPPILSANNFNDIYTHLLNLYNDLDFKKSIGKKSSEWFNKNCGIELASKIIKSVTV